MKSRVVVLTPDVEDDLASIYDYIAERGSPNAALDFLSRIEQFCRSLSHAAERGMQHPSIRDGFRTIGFERRVTIAFQVSGETVYVLRVFYAGRNWQDAFKPSD